MQYQSVTTRSRSIDKSDKVELGIDQHPSWRKIGKMHTFLTFKAGSLLKVTWLFCSIKPILKGETK
jgi:hypothetical protein